MRPMVIIPETKDWTWVIDRPCDECGFDATSFPRESVGDILRRTAGDFAAVLRARPDVRDRPDDSTWSPLEYGCHVRDVCVLYDRRLAWMLTDDDPLFPNWDQDATAVESAYVDDDPAAVAVDLEAAAQALAQALDDVAADQWSRPGRRSDGASFTVETFARYFIHDPVHHLHDVRR